MNRLQERESGQMPGAAVRKMIRAPLFLADWMRLVFIHYQVDPKLLQRSVPFSLHLRDGCAYVSFVAFTMGKMRFYRGGSITRWLLRPISDHGLLNLRTYVSVNGEPGIYFLAEWLQNRLAIPLGRPAFGLPYRWAWLRYSHDHAAGPISGIAESPSGRFQYRETGRSGFQVCQKDSLTEFLLERYTAFTCWRGCRRCFRVWHPPWRQIPIAIEVGDSSLLKNAGEWGLGASLVGANFSPGVQRVWMGFPEQLPPEE